MATPPACALIPCHVREVRYCLPQLRCDRCGGVAPAVWEVSRTAIDIDLDQPVLLQVHVSVHRCRPCQHYLRAQPAFLRPDAIYTNRVLAKAVASVYEDGLAFRAVPARLARDFWVQPSETMIRQWCRLYSAGVDFTGAYQDWVVREFSGILCVDEAYQGDLALLVAVDPAAPEGDRLVGYQLVQGTVDQTVVTAFLGRLAALGITPEQVVTDGSSLYPAVLRAIWPTAAHQLCLFHETRQVVDAVAKVIRALGKTLPDPPPAPRQGRGGPLRAQPPTDNPADSATQRWHARQAERNSVITTVHRLHQQGLSQRAVARQLGLHRKTVKAYLALPVPDLPASDAPPLPGPAARQLPGESPSSDPPPAPWHSWEEVRQVREALAEHRFLLLRRPNHLNAEEQAQVHSLLTSPLAAPLGVAHTFLQEWYGLWYDETGQRRTLAAALCRYICWQDDPTYQAVPGLQRVLERITPAHFAHLSHFLAHPGWEATNDAAERTARAFRHQQAPHFNLRSASSIEATLRVEACLHRERCLAPPARPHQRKARGRLPRAA